MKKTLLSVLLIAAFITAGCQYKYRYACQDPANWEKAECKRPVCEVDGTCPDQLLQKQITEDKIAAALELEENNEANSVDSAEAGTDNCEDKPQGE